MFHVKHYCLLSYYINIAFAHDLGTPSSVGYFDKIFITLFLLPIFVICLLFVQFICSLIK